MPGVLNHTPADIVRAALIAAGQGVAPGDTDFTTPWQIFVNKEPNKPENVITCYDDQGEDQGREMVSNGRFTRDGVQVRFRTIDGQANYPRLRQLAVALDQMNMISVTISGSIYQLWTFIRKGEPLFLGDLDDRSAVAWTINGLVSVNQLS